jgi:DNA-directed RNA polymerase specialized sigma24 family protein
MKIKWKFANGDVSEVEVSDEVGTIIIDSRKAEHAQQEKERYHCYSLDAIDYEGLEYADKETPQSILEQNELNERVRTAFSHLTEIQQKRLLLLSEGLSIRDIARLEGKHHSTIEESVNSARKKFLKNY